MPVYLVDLFMFLTLSMGFLWLTNQKKLSGGLAMAGAASWLIGGFLALAAIRLNDVSAENAGGIMVMGRVLPTLVAFFYLWSRPDWLPTRSIHGVKSQCVYREPGPVSSKRVGAFLVENKLRASHEAQSVWVAAMDVSRARKLLPSFIAWTRVFNGREATQGQFVADWLKRNGVDAQIRGEMKTGIMGGIPVQDSFPDVWVRGADKPRAQVLIAEMDKTVEGEAWTCPWCDEDNGSAFAACWSCEKAGPQKIST
ncbi:MAG: hypothetical protein ACJAZO_004286 [Myxococcota bacterium]|jgi:hypothetical protein